MVKHGNKKVIRLNNPKKATLKSSKKKINSFLDCPGSEWLVNDQISSKIIIDTLTATNNINLNYNILIPGIGKSRIALELYKYGFINLTLIDIEDESIAYQTQLFQQFYEENPNADVSNIKIIELDLLTYTNSDNYETTTSASDTSTPSTTTHTNCDIRSTKYDLIIDKCFMDVFLGQGHSKLIWSNLLSLLTPYTGSIIVFSMFHSKWKNILIKNIYNNVLYTSINIPKYSRTRPTITRFSSPFAVFYIQQNDQKGQKGRNSDLSQTNTPLICGEYKYDNFHDISRNELPLDAAYFN